MRIAPKLRGVLDRGRQTAAALDRTLAVRMPGRLQPHAYLTSDGSITILTTSRPAELEDPANGREIDRDELARRDPTLLQTWKNGETVGWIWPLFASCSRLALAAFALALLVALTPIRPPSAAVLAGTIVLLAGGPAALRPARWLAIILATATTWIAAVAFGQLAGWGTVAAVAVLAVLVAVRRGGSPPASPGSRREHALKLRVTEHDPKPPHSA